MQRAPEGGTQCASGAIPRSQTGHPRRFIRHGCRERRGTGEWEGWVVVSGSVCRVGHARMQKGALRREKMSPAGRTEEFPVSAGCWFRDFVASCRRRPGKERDPPPRYTDRVWPGPIGGGRPLLAAGIGLTAAGPPGGREQTSLGGESPFEGKTSLEGKSSLEKRSRQPKAKKNSRRLPPVALTH